MIGQTLAHYQITDHLGRGGMGEVFRARDTKLDRDVALKLLHDDVARDPERLARFRREAKVLASLNHANIASLYGLEEADGRVFLIMELAEGEDLTERIARGPMPADELTRVTAGIARGLEAAHENGVVHRDLKPSNIKLSPDGEVKILDFGLARAYANDDTSSSSIEDSPTITAAFTGANVILGTAAYMSPEQARGRPVDKRTDIWAFGVVLWEMITGERLFAGETVSDTLALVLTREVDVRALPEDLPPTVRHLVSRCLQRDPRNRLRDIGEARLFMEDPSAASVILSSNAMDGNATSDSKGRPPLALIVPWILLVAVIAVGLPRLLGSDTQPSQSLPLRRFEFRANLPALYNTRAVEISPDGTKIAIFGNDGLWVRHMDSIEPRLLLGPEELSFDDVGGTPFWSPDSEWIAFAAQGQLKRIPVSGGTTSVICTLPGGWSGGAWGDDGTIVFNQTRGPMYWVSARGGDPEVLLPLVDGEILDYHQPTFVFDGGGFVYSVHRVSAVDTIEFYRNGERTVLLQLDEAVQGSVQLLNNPVYSPSGHIVYQRDQGNRGLWALPFDAASGTVTGPPFFVRAGVGHPSVSRDGTLVHTKLFETASGRLVTVSREGEILETLSERLPGVATPCFSSDGRRIAYSAAPEQNQDIFLYDRDSELTTQLTFSEEPENQPAWIPRSNRLSYSAPHEGVCSGIWARDLSSDAEPEFLAPQGADPTFGPDGLDLVYVARCRKERGLWYKRLDSDEPPVVLRDHSSGLQTPSISPDGKLIAYVSWETGSATLEVANFPDMSGRHLIARTQTHLRWSAHGDEIFYGMQDSGKLVAAQLEPGPGFRIRSTTTLFDLAQLGIKPYMSFDINPDGDEFVFVQQIEAAESTRSFTVVENWFEEFREN